MDDPNLALELVIFSSRKLQRVRDVLNSPDPAHNERVWLVGFLGYCGFSEREIIEIIRKLNKWRDYNGSITEYQVRSVLKSSKAQKSSFLPSSSQPPPHHIGYEKFESLHAEELEGLDSEQRAHCYHRWVAEKYAKGMKLEDSWGVRGV
jgi:hypothetical protein